MGKRIKNVKSGCDADDLLIGVARRDITPPVGCELVGYRLRYATSVGHPLRAEALAVRSGGRGWVVVTTDLCGLARCFVVEIRRTALELLGGADCAIMIAADHTHSGPAANKAGWFPAHRDQAYFESLKGKIVEAICEAWQTSAPGRLEAAETQAPELASNRRVQGPDGRWTNEWQDPEGKHGGFFDPTVTLTAARRPSGRIEAMLVTYGCHPVVLGHGSTAISTDYCGYLKDALEEKGIGTALFGVAGHGNIDPKVLRRDGSARSGKNGPAPCPNRSGCGSAAATRVTALAGTLLAELECNPHQNSRSDTAGAIPSPAPGGRNI